MSKASQHLEPWQIEEYLTYLISRSSDPPMDSEQKGSKNDDYERIEERKDFLQWEHHISECDQCAGKMHLLYTHAQTFQDWDVRSDNAYVLQTHMRKALEHAAAICSDNTIRQRLLEWKAKEGGLSQAAVKIFLKAKQMGRRLVSQISMEGVSSILHPKAHFGFEYANVGLSGRSLDKARPIHDKTTVSLIEGSADLDMRISIDNQIQGFHIRMEGKENQKIPIFLIFRKNLSDKPILCMMEYDQQAKAWISEISDLLPGEYLLAVEPLHSLKS